MRFAFSQSALPEKYDLPGFKVLDISRVLDLHGVFPREVITLQAEQEELNEVFSHLAQDIVVRTAREQTEADAARILRSRLALWQRLLQRERAMGLSIEEQRGLYGELYALQTLLISNLPSLAAVQAWTGPLGISQDFQMPEKVALEVKTSLARPPHQIAITGEGQLDDTGLDFLFLLHVLVDAKRGTGESLPDRVDALRALLVVDDPAAADIFEDLLLEAGYLDAHSPQQRYREPGYTLRTMHLYHVHDEFPRILPSSLPPGLGQVQYCISASACKEYEVSVSSLADHLHQAETGEVNSTTEPLLTGEVL